MKKPTFVLHEGVRILVVDYSNSRPEDLKRRLEDSAAIIRAETKPLLVLSGT